MEGEDAAEVDWGTLRPGQLVCTCKHFVELWERGQYGLRHVNDIDRGSVLLVVFVKKNEALIVLGGCVGWVLKYDASFLRVVG